MSRARHTSIDPQATDIDHGHRHARAHAPEAAVTSTRKPNDRLLTVAEAAERLGTTVRFTRRLIAEKRVTYVKLGPGRSSPVRIPERAIEDLIAAATIEAAR